MGSLWIRKFGNEEHRALLSDWPLPRPRKWIAYVNQPANHAQRDAVLVAEEVRHMVLQLNSSNRREKYGLESTQRRPGRPRP